MKQSGIIGFLITALLVFFYPTLHSQTLRRQSALGMQFSYTSESLRKEMGLPEAILQVASVFPGFTGAELAMKPGDVLLSINDITVRSVTDLFLAERKLRNSTSCKAVIFRNGHKVVLQGNVIPRPFETSKEQDIIYDQFSFMNGQIRCIFNKLPGTQKSPAILFIPGYTCYNMDNLPEHNIYRQVVYTLAGLGYVVMRAEKPGLGDSEGTPDCNDIDFPTEVNSFIAAYDKLKSLPYVDSSNIFIFGHSLGGMVAPLVAASRHPRGVISFGITIKGWREYLTEMLRVQNIGFGYGYRQTGKDLKLYETLLYELLVLKKMPAELIRKNPDYEPLLKRDFLYSGREDFLTRHVRFSQSLNDVDFFEAWSNVQCKVLSIHGEYDVQALNPYSHEELVQLVNQQYPGNATYLLAPKTDHNLVLVDSMEESFELTRTGQIVKRYATHFNHPLMQHIHEWIKSVCKK